ncbi:MAG: hypothetical protein RLN60_01040 [Phycisphaerales bacterium]
MSRTFTNTLAATAVLGLAGTAFGQNVNVTAPEFNMLEGVGQASGGAIPTNLIVNIPAGIAAFGNGNNLTFNLSFFTVASDGTVTPLGMAFDVAVPNAAVDSDADGAVDAGQLAYNNAAGNTALVDLSMIAALPAGVNNAVLSTPAGGAAGIQIQVTDDTTMMTDSTVNPMALTSGEFDTAAESPRIITNTNEPFTLVNAFFSNDAMAMTDTVVFEFSHPLNQGSFQQDIGAAGNAGTDVNQTLSDAPGMTPIGVLMGGGAGNQVVAGNASFQASAAGDFTDAVFLSAGVGMSANLLGGNNNFLSFTDAQANILSTIGTTVRVAAMGGVSDIYGRTLPATMNMADATNAVALQAPATFTFTGATAIARAAASAPMGATTTTANAFRLTFSNPILTLPSNDALTLLVNGAVSAAASFDDGVDDQNNDGDGMANTGTGQDIEATIDPMDSNSILVEFNSIAGMATPGAGIDAMGREVSQFGADSGIFSVTVGDGTTDIADIFGSSITTTSAAMAAADGINPSQNGSTTYNVNGSTAVMAGQGPATLFVDVDGDGTQDGIGIITDEPVSIMSANAATAAAKVGGTMVFPFDQIMSDGTLVSDTIVAAAMAMNDAISITGVSLMSLDQGPNAGTVDPIEMNNTVVFMFDPTAVDWDEDGMVGAADTDGEASPGTGDAGATSLAIDITDNNIQDLANNMFDNGSTMFPATASGFDVANPVFITALHNNSENISDYVAPVGMNLSVPGAYTQCFAETSDDDFDEFSGAAGAAGVTQAADVGNNRTDRGIFAFSEAMGAIGNATGIQVNGSNLSALALSSAGGANGNIVTVVDPGFNNAEGGSFLISTGAGFADITGNAAANTTGTLGDGTDPYLPLSLAADNVTVTHSAFLVDDDAMGESGAGFADSVVLFMNGAVDSTLLDDAAEQTASAADFAFMGFAFTPTSIMQDADNPNILTIAIPDDNVSTAGTQNVTYNGATATTLLTGDAKNSTFITTAPIEAPVDTESPFVMAILGNITINGSPAPIGTQVCGMIAVPTVRSLRAEKNGLTFRYDRADIDQELAPIGPAGAGVGGAVSPIVVSESAIKRSLEDFTNVILGLEERVYLLCNSNNLDLYSNTKFPLDKAGFPIGGSFEVIDLDVNSSNLDRISFSGRSGSSSSSQSVSSGTVQLCYDVLRSRTGTMESLFEDGYCIGGAPIISKAVVTNTSGNYSLYVSLPNLEASDSDDGLGTDSNVFATARLHVVVLVETPDGQIFPAAGLLNNVNGTGPIVFSSEILSQTSDGEASGATTFNINTGNVGFEQAFAGYNLIGHGRASGFARASNSIPVLPDGVVADNVRTGTSLLPPAGPEDQFVWWADANANGMFDSAELNSIVVDNNCITTFPFVINSQGVQLGTNGINAIVGGYSFGMFTTATLGCAQFGAALAEDGIFTTNDFPNSSSNRGWAFVTVTQDYASMDDFFSDNPDVDYVILFDRTSAANVNVASASPAGGPVSANDLTSLSSGDAIIIHTNN